MNMYLKKGLSLILGTSMILPFATGISTNADTIDYVAFGDSIAYGYGLENIQDDGFVYLVGDYLNADVSNYAINMTTSTDLLEMLQSGDYDEDITNAEVITLTIGSNDILLPFVDIMYSSLGLEGHLDTAFKDWYDNTDIFTKLQALNNINLELSNNTTLDEACENFETNTFPTIISDIRELNPDCEIIVTEFYNPYYNVNLGGVFDLGTLSDKYIQTLNNAIHNNPISSEYKIAEIYEDFNTTGLTNINLDTQNLDPHPNVEGHKIIANAVIENLEIEPSTDIGTSENTTLIGDIDCNGDINAVDVLILKKYVLGMEVSLESAKNADINIDNDINVVDVLLLKRIVLQMD